MFVLCTSRSGSTLLRFVLDAHPDLACPPEMKLPFVLAQLARLWSATDGLGRESANGGPAISEAAAVGIRQTMDQMIGPYLARRGKTRYCDKNLGTEPHVETLLAVYPEAKFICLYRHPMDMIASGVEACPWGLSQYGFEPYVAHAPGNSVLALARYWSDHISAILAVEDKFPGRCHRVRYEDLVADPETVASGMFQFLGLPPAPGISARAFSRDRERTGPGDFKIWNTSQISDDSVGRGWSVPADLIPGPLTETINGLVDRLGYVRIDASWGTVRKPSDLRLPAEGQALASRSADRGGPVPAGALLVSERLQRGLRRADNAFIGEWRPYSDGPFLMVALAPTGPEDDVWWLVDLAGARVVSGTGNCTESRGWTISAPAATWEQVIRDGLNLGIAFRRHGMRYRDQGGGGAGSTTADNRVSMMSDLLGIVTWSPDRTDSPGPPLPPTEIRPARDQRLAGQLAAGQLAGGPTAAQTAASQQAAQQQAAAQRSFEQRAAGQLAAGQPRTARPRDGQPTAGLPAADDGSDDHPADDELLPWERDRQPSPGGPDLDAALWQPTPAEPGPRPNEPQPPRLTRFTISTAGRTAQAATPGDAPPRDAPSSKNPSRDTSVGDTPARNALLLGIPARDTSIGNTPARDAPAADMSARSAEPGGSVTTRPRPTGPSYSRSAAARERLRLEREQESRRRRRRLRVITLGTIALIAAGVTTSIALQPSGTHHAPKVSAPPARPGFGYSGPYAPVTLNADNSVTMAQPGVSQPVLDVYEDFQCSACRTFEQGSGATIQQLADQGKVKVVYYPFTVFGSQPQRASSIRAWSAAKCVPASLWARYHNLLYASQPAPTAAGGFTPSLLIRLGQTAGITSSGFAQCVQSQQFAVQDAPLSDQIMNSGVTSMLTLRLNGQALNPDVTAAQLRRVIISASSRKTTA